MSAYIKRRMRMHKLGFHRGGLKGTSMYREKKRFRPRSFRKGYDRTSGNYGKFASGLELKFHDTSVESTTILDTGEITSTLNAISQGTGESERIGRKITIKSIGFRWEVFLPTTTNKNNTSDQLRVILYLDKQCNGAAANVNDILEDQEIRSFNNLANKSRFRTLMDRTYDIDAFGGLGANGPTDSAVIGMSDDFYKKCNIPIEFNSTLGALTEIRSNNIGLLLISGRGFVDFKSKFRFRYTDM